MPLAPGKKRYNFSLTEKNYMNFQQILRGIGAPKGIESQVVDAFISELVIVLEGLKKKQEETGKAPTMGDLFQLIGASLDRIDDEQPQLKL